MSFRIILLPLLLFISLGVNAYWNESWAYRTEVNITLSGNSQTDYPVAVEISAGDLYSGYSWSSDGSDLRVIDSDDSSELHFWIESWDSSAQTARIWVNFPSISAGSERTVYFYYGNSGSVTSSSVYDVFQGGVAYQSRYNTTNPDSWNQAATLFNNRSISSGYGDGFVSNFANIENSNLFGASSNIVTYIHASFYVASAGYWQIRYGADFGYGGELRIDGSTKDARWENEYGGWRGNQLTSSEDLWWNGSWSNTDGVLNSGAVYLSQGIHTFEIRGAESSDDGPTTLQFCRPSRSSGCSTNNNGWTTIATTALSVFVPPDDGGTAGVEYGDTVLAGYDLGLTVTAPEFWAKQSARDLVLRVTNQGSQTVTSGTGVQLNMGYNLIIDSVSGSGWSCQSGNWSVCTYNGAAVTSGDSYPDLILSVIPGDDEYATTGDYGASVFNYSISDANSDNNSVNGALDIRDVVIPSGTSCPAGVSLSSGVWASFYDTSDGSMDYPDTAAEYQQLVDTFGTSAYLYGSEELNNINGSGNPFDAASEHYLTVFRGYLYIPQDGTWLFAVDGDDAVEFWLDGQVRTAIYGPHSANNSPQNPVTLYLEAGYHSLEYRHQEYTGSDSYRLYWKTPDDSSYSIVPSSGLFQCSGYTSLTISAASEVLSDPVNGTNNPKAIPGAVVRYTVTVSNYGTITPDSGSTGITQALDNNMALYVGDGSVSPVTVDTGTLGLSYTYENISSTTDSLEFSSDPSSVTDSDGYATGISSFMLNLGGTMTAGSETNPPSMTYQYQVRLQ